MNMCEVVSKKDNRCLCTEQLYINVERGMNLCWLGGFIAENEQINRGVFMQENKLLRSTINSDLPSTFIPDTNYVICYYYYPATVSEREASEFVTSMEALMTE